VLVPLMGSCFLSEVDDTSILRTAALHHYHYPLTWLPVSRLLLPAQRAGAQRLCALAGGIKALKPKPNGGRKHENMTLAEEKALLARFARTAGAGEC
jgi:hypothetical protein